jgi:rRNA-processing protein FCF1
VLDTNVLFLVVQRGFPLEGEIDRLLPGARIVLPSSAARELRDLVERRTVGAAAAREVAARYPVVRTARSGDDGVVDAAVRARARVVTADRALQQRLVERGIDVLVPRDRTRLQIRRGAGPAGSERRPGHRLRRRDGIARSPRGNG